MPQEDYQYNASPLSPSVQPSLITRTALDSLLSEQVRGHGRKIDNLACSKNKLAFKHDEISVAHDEYQS